MSDNYTDDDFSSDEELDAAEDQSPRGLRRAANKAKKLEQELAKLQRELAFSRAGIPMDDPKMSYFIRGYDGEMTAEAIREAALEAGFLGSQQPAAEDVQLQADAAAQQRVMSASAGASQDAMTEDAVLSQLEQAMEEGGVEAFLDVARSFGMPTSIEQ